jgi:hypothetical protein
MVEETWRLAAERITGAVDAEFSAAVQIIFSAGRLARTDTGLVAQLQRRLRG